MAVKTLLWRVAIAALLVGLWQVVSGSLLDPFWLSRPTEVAAYLWDSLLRGPLLADLSLTIQATAIGYAIGAVLGLVLGFVLAQSEPVALVLKPFVLAVYGVPRIALAPLFILWFGIALQSTVMMAAMMTFMLVFFNTYEGVRSADLELRNVARILGATRWKLFLHVTVPNASPWIIAGLRVSIPQALVAAVVAEFIASTGGLGYRIMETTSGLNTAGTMGGVVVLMAVVVVLNLALDRMEGRALKWRPTDAKGRK
jgi:NitT/TauT family transport system permease protein